MAGPTLSRALALLSACSVLYGAQAKVYESRFNGTTWDDDNWRVTTTDLQPGMYQSRMSLANGYLGINLANVGPFFEIDSPADINGWPLFDRRQTFATIAGFYDREPRVNGTNFEWLYQYDTGESVISGVPHWSGLHVQVGDQILAANVPTDQISRFSSTLDVGAGTMSWSYTWSPSNESAIDIEYTMLVHKLYVNQAAVQLKLTASRDVNVSVIDLLDGDCAVRTDFVGKEYMPVYPTIWSAVSPVGVDNVTAYIVSSLVGDDSCDSSSRRNFTDEAVIGANSSSIAQAVDVVLKAGKTSIVTKYVGGASTDAFDNPKSTAINGSWSGAAQGFSSMLESQIAEWSKILPADSVDSYRLPDGSIPENPEILELQITAYTNAYHMLQNTVGTNAIIAAGNNTQLDVNSIAVGGLGSSSYAGWIFWDAEVWMAPGLVVAHPQAAEQIANYRVKLLPQAQANLAVSTEQSGTVNQTGRFAPNGAAYPWISGRYGNCTGAGPCFDYEYHLGGDIGLELYNYYTVTGDTDYFREELYPIYDAIAQFYADAVTYNETIDRYELLNATDPDEYANFERNVGYTMVLMKTHIETANTLRTRLGMDPNTTWATIADKILVPVYADANIILEYADMNNTVQVKQADIVLIDDFLNFPNNQSLNDLDYYAGKQSNNGPGMTYGVFSVVANEISPSGCSSYTYDIEGSAPYIRGPWFQFSEQLTDNYNTNGGTHPAYPFLTGHGGANRVAVFGYLGLRLMLDSFNINPNLPPQIPQLEYRTIYWQGWPIKGFSNQTHTTLTRLSTPLDNANSTFAAAAIPVTIGVAGESQFGNTTVYQLEPNGTITLSNRRIGEIKTVPGNVAQCRPATSTQNFLPGQFPFAAVDGAVSTRWQPEHSNITSSVTVELSGDAVLITEVQFDWGQAPPTSYVVTFSNSSDATDSVNVTSSTNIEISAAYNAATAFEIVPYTSNATNITLDSPVYSGRYATLEIRGNQATIGTPNESNGTGATVAEFVLVAASGENVAKRQVRFWTA
ncbi:alpha,alpha-trehalase ath1 [Elasticomyces elasticus]|nr:alpha,alpha-trehalase ath1 [Elasticomyces elasticus]KAK4966780.1 alpha,alpha-trehalase ath1 [Elasticomyces elasticus]